MPARSLSPSILTLAALALASGCTTFTPVTRTALVPGASAPAAAGRPLERGEWKLAGAVDSLELGPQAFYVHSTPGYGDAGLLIPTAQLAGQAWVGLSRAWSAGVQLHWAPREWARPSALGVLDLPECDEPFSALTGGLGLRGSWRIADAPVWLSVSTELDWARVAQATWAACTECDDSAGYRLARVQAATAFAPNFYLHLGGDVGRRVHLSLFGGAQTGVRNNGFDTLDNLGASTLDTYPILMAGTGVELRLGRVLLDANLIVPWAPFASIDYGPALVLKAGVSL